ncbi:hypothetical protein BE04_35960 [Sorangium cellulosum]|uniref:Uncharacterized protein n=2 Tax=Sorangium cellulosum TaxID=56 RepID=A0A150P4W3_SORCE|nr:hypothetical protein [Sorangium cellulosum]AGP40395.1 hypothetical protein SCE1572_41370 [Sorangium cellulosum So0157-2]KYF50732.1 hypothetical protein BE04_35960 [Sorangium cellulosum]
MGNPKTSKSPKASKADRTEAAPLDEALDEATPTELDAVTTAFLGRVHTLLFNIPRYLDRARRHGYTQKEHDLGWELYTTASGKNRRFEHWLAESDQRDVAAGVSAERMRLLQEIDAFENLWFPRMRALIPRVLPRDSADRFAAAFFKDLAQQPLSPAVVDSVKTFLNRVDELASSAEPGARKLYETLGERGLTPKKIEAMRRLIAAAEEHRTPDRAAPALRRDEIAKAKEAQLAALESLRLWYNDWATTFRGVFGTRAQVTLGLTSLKRRKKDAAAAEEAAAESEEADGDAGDF